MKKLIIAGIISLLMSPFATAKVVAPVATFRVTAGTTISVSDSVKKYFKDIPVMAKIARCESGYHQFNKDGSIFRGIVNSNDVGVMQVNTTYHLQKSKSLGIDILTLDGNMEYALYLYDTEGLAPWNASRPCWG